MRPDRPKIVRRHLALGMALASAVLAEGCAVGPDFHRPAAPGADHYTPQALAPISAGGETQSFNVGTDVPADWWTLYRSPSLNRLVDKALKANPDLEAAQAALRAARETYLAQKGAFLPTVDLGFDASRQKASVALSPPLSTSQLMFNLYNTQVDVGYSPDVFGGLRRQTESVAAQTKAQRFATEATRLTLEANVVAAVIQQASLKDQIAADQAAIRDEAETLKVMRRQMALGQVGGADVAAQGALLAQAEQVLPPLQKQQAQTRDLIAALTGDLPGQIEGAEITLGDLALPADLPVSLPVKLVERRPDVRAAEANLHAASAQVGVAVAARLPIVSLSANAGGTATNMARLFSQGDGFWGLAGGVTEPIFQGGALLHRQKAAEAQFDQAKAQYRSTVTAACQNVADILQALQSDAAAMSAAERSEASARTSLDIAKAQLGVGAVSGLAVLAAEQTYEQALAGRVQARANRLADTAALFQAMGGDGWRRGET